MTFSTEIEKTVLKCIWNLKGPQVAKITLKKKNKFGGVILPNFKTLYKATIIKTVFYQQKQGHIDIRIDERFLK